LVLLKTKIGTRENTRIRNKGIVLDKGKRSTGEK
jgi:hypothetical protein